jgi:hypothetical protein
MKQLSAIIHHRSKNRTTPFPNFRHRLRDRPNLWVYCYQHRLWNLHGLAPKCEVAEPDKTFFILDESEPGTITGRKPHHEHEGEFWIVVVTHPWTSAAKSSPESRRKTRIRPDEPGFATCGTI